MVHTTIRSPLSATIAVIAAGAVVLSTTTIEPPRPPAALTASTISAQAVHLTALAGPLQVARAAGASSEPASVGNALPSLPTAIADGLKNVILSPVAGAAAGVFFGFIGGGLVAMNLLQWVPEQFDVLLTPVVQAAAVLGAIVGVPIGAVVGPIIAIRTLVSSILSPSNPAATAAARVPGASGRNAVATSSARVPAVGGRTAATAPLRTTQPGVRPHRSIAKPSASSASKAAPSASSVSQDAVPQQHSKATRNSTGHARDAASKRSARH